MACINKNTKEWTDLEERYGDFPAAVIVRGHPRNNKAIGENENFYIPTIMEARNILSSKIPAAAKRKVINQLDMNPLSTEDALASLLVGFIHKTKFYGNNFVINVGDKNNNPFAKKDIYRPAVNMLNELQELYPRIFKVKPTEDGNTFYVFITPKQANERNLFDYQSPSMTDAINKFQYLTRLKGYQPEVFDTGNNRWIQVTTDIYQLVNKNNGTVIGNTINLTSGVAQESATPLDREANAVAIREVEALASQESFAMVFSLYGSNIDLVLRNMKEATTQEEFDIEYSKVKKFYCK